MLTALERSVLVAVEKLTHDNLLGASGSAVGDELRRMGFDLPDDRSMMSMLFRLRDDGYLDRKSMHTLATSFEGVHRLTLTTMGRREARTAEERVDPFERVHAETRGLLSSDEFRAAYPAAFAAWSSGERLLWSEDAQTKLTAIGHHAREAMQEFATALVQAHGPSNVDPDPAHARARVGAVIAMHRRHLGDARRIALEALGDLWEAADALVQRQEHAAQKEREPVTWWDARRVIVLSMYCMVELAAAFERPSAPRVLGSM